MSARMSEDAFLQSSFGQIPKSGCGVEGCNGASVFRAGEARQVCASAREQTERTFGTPRGCANWRMRMSRRSGRLGAKSFRSTGSEVAVEAWSTASLPDDRLVHTRAARRGSVLPGAFLRSTQPSGESGGGGRGARSGARVKSSTWHLPHGETPAGERRAAAAPSGPSGPRLSTLRPRRGESGWAGEGGEGRGRREGGRWRGASPRRGRALARAVGIARRRCGNVRHVGHGAGSGSGGRAADLVCGSGRGRRGAVFGRGGRPCCGRGQ